jgi:hypothetical protein
MGEGARRYGVTYHERGRAPRPAVATIHNPLAHPRREPASKLVTIRAWW